MKGNAKVIAELNLALREELTAINQYFLHAEMCHKWGYHALGNYIKKQSIDEMKHAEKLIERLLFLDATPQMNYMDLNIGGNVKAQLEGDLKLTHGAEEVFAPAGSWVQVPAGHEHAVDGQFLNVTAPSSTA